VLVLAVERDQPPAELPEVRRRCRPPLHERPRPPVGADPAPEHDLVGVLRQPLAQLGEVGVVEQPLRRLEHALDVCLGGSGADDPRAGLTPEQQVERMGEHRLAGTGLAGQRVQAGPEPQLGPLDQEQVLDAKLYEHMFGSTGPTRRNE
jgi:hypothetical protein